MPSCEGLPSYNLESYSEDNSQSELAELVHDQTDRHSVLTARQFAGCVCQKPLGSHILEWRQIQASNS